jgi:DNA polymerase zeta
VLQRCFNARQFALKLIANVTYGYTAAGTHAACALARQL